MNVTPIIGESTFPALDEISDEELAEIGVILGLRRRFDLSVYKSKCMKRRVAIRMRSTRCRDVSAYCTLLQQSDHELDLLQKTLTIHVSQFFRNPSMFEKLRTDVMPGLFMAREDDAPEPLHLCCLGCAGGEEPYSLAILLREYFARELRHVRVVITGTDIDPETLQAARQGEYSEDRLKDVPEDIRDRYFQRRETRFRLISPIREMVTFFQSDITKVGEYARNDLILCRNTLIYFTRPDQEKILSGIADALQPGGILVLGKSESLVGAARPRFAPVCPTERIYRRV
jgi:chemotaxis protein methyltransferase CheR